MSDVFSFDDLFITVRDSSLRAYNRLVFVTNNYGDKPKLKRRYLSAVRELDMRALEEINAIQRQLNASGPVAVQRVLKYRTNPYEDHEAISCTKSSLPLFQPFS